MTCKKDKKNNENIQLWMYSLSDHIKNEPTGVLCDKMS